MEIIREDNCMHQAGALLMCLGAILLFSVGQLVFGAADPCGGASSCNFCVTNGFERQVI